MLVPSEHYQPRLSLSIHSTLKHNCVFQTVFVLQLRVCMCVCLISTVCIPVSSVCVYLHVMYIFNRN